MGRLLSVGSAHPPAEDARDAFFRERGSARNQPGDAGRLTSRSGELPSIEARPQIERAPAQIDCVGTAMVVDLKCCHIAHRSLCVEKSDIVSAGRDRDLSPT